MADHVGNGDGATASSVRVLPSHYVAHRRREIKRGRDPREDIDLISSLPDEILQIILSFISTKLAITTSVLSRRWRHVWCDTPSLSFSDNCNLDPSSVDKILSRCTARKMMSFQLCAIGFHYRNYVNSWIEFAKSRNVENLLLEKHGFDDIPDSFYTNSSVKQLYLKSAYGDDLDPKCSVLDLSKSPRLKTLEIESEYWLQGVKIVAPHIHSLRLRFTISDFAYSLVDVSPLTEAELDVDSGSHEKLNVYYIKTIVLKMLEKLQNVEKLTLCGNFLKALSLADLHCYSFPKLKVKVLTLETTISQDVISGIVRLLQHSPELKKLTLRTMDCDARRGYVDNYLDSYSWIPNQCSESWVFGDIKSRDVETKHVALFMELVLKTTKTLKKMVVRLGPYRSERGIKELRQMDPMLSHDNDVSIVLIATKRWIRESSSKW
ncbi:PREDICTED: F-box/LRR-repeat protein At3g03360-like [Camelina sativa]|uniref:F-box/LRR-repeat protein At3g03360-like n=1 Tax=Camelina sativa TaxID=90675 RepID=A0ABM0YXW5_CAMSA|nr:PREDICTED: F-box/LRR-repeat protein At3g03360-like [Camelina sativa]